MHDLAVRDYLMYNVCFICLDTVTGMSPQSVEGIKRIEEIRCECFVDFMKWRCC